VLVVLVSAAAAGVAVLVLVATDAVVAVVVRRLLNNQQRSPRLSLRLYMFLGERLGASLVRAGKTSGTSSWTRAAGLMLRETRGQSQVIAVVVIVVVVAVVGVAVWPTEATAPTARWPRLLRLTTSESWRQ
jgi:hypothetical protein